MRWRAVSAGIAVTTALVSPAAAEAERAGTRLAEVVPAPVEVHPAPDAGFELTADTGIHVGPGTRQVGEYLAGLLRPATGYQLPVRGKESARSPEIALRLGGTDPRIGRQGYQLRVTRAGVTIRANTAAGAFAGVQTLRQLLPARIEGSRPQPGPWTVPGGRILDYPRFGYRGAMLDLARHFHTPGEVKAYIDQLAAYKINYLHLHLTDDQGWRIQIDSWPELTTKGGGPGTGVDGVGGGYLTKAEYAELIDYAASRHMVVVPEVDMPGHTNAALSTYAELNCDGVAPPPRTDIEVGYSSLCIGKEITYEFVADVVRELAEMTPGPYLHIGGDEAHATSAEEYLTFMRKLLPIVGRHGKAVLGWDEIARAEMPASAVPQFWDTDGKDTDVAKAAARGNKILLSPANRSYLDMKYHEGTALGLDWAGYIEVRDAYGWDPASAVQDVGEESVLGVEAPLWSETLRSLDDIEFMAFPRLPAIAEKGWSTASASQDWESFRDRLAAHGPRWILRGINYYRSPQIPPPG